MAVLANSQERRDYLKGLFETTYFRDIVERNSLRRFGSLDELCNIVSETTGSLLNAERIANTFKSVKGENIDKQTVGRYIGFFEDAFLIREARRYDLKGRAEIGALRKYYFTDTMQREVRPYLALRDQVQKVVVVNRPIEECRNENGFTIIGAPDFLLRYIEG